MAGYAQGKESDESARESMNLLAELQRRNVICMAVPPASGANA